MILEFRSTYYTPSTYTSLCEFIHYRFVTQLLTDVIYFVACEENTGGDPLEVKGTAIDRERQKLLREQNILKQVTMEKRTLLST